MARTPFVPCFWSPWAGIIQPSRPFDQHSGRVIPADQFFRPMMSPRPYGLPVQQPVPEELKAISEVVNNDKEFRISVDVSDFLPEEINIKTRGNRVIFHARHNERPEEDGFNMPEFSWRFQLPRDVDPASVTSTLNRDRVLTIKAPKMALEGPRERVIPIQEAD